MTIRIVVGVVVLGFGTVVVLQLEGAVEVLAWEVLMVIALVTMARRAWPGRPEKLPALIGGRGLPFEGRPLRLLAALELEVGAAIDPRLSGDARLRRRLRDLAHHRVERRGRRAAGEEMRRLLGEADWQDLTETDRALDLSRVERLADRIEAL